MSNNAKAVMIRVPAPLLKRLNRMLLETDQSNRNEYFLQLIEKVVVEYEQSLTKEYQNV